MFKKFDFVRKTSTFLFSISMLVPGFALGANQQGNARVLSDKQCERLYKRASNNPNANANRLIRKFPECAAWVAKLDGVDQAQQDAQAQAGQNPAPVNTVPMIAGNAGAGVLLRNDGTVFAWGVPSYGGDLSLSGIVPSTGQMQLEATGPTFASQLTSIKAVYATREAFAALRHDGTVYAWGAGRSGDNSLVASLSDVREIVSNDYAFAAIRNDGTVFAWGDSSHGGDASAVSSQLTGVTSIAASSNAFAAVRDAANNHTVVVWGTGAVIDETTVASLSNVRQVFSNGHAFVAVRNDGSAHAWGDRQLGGGGVSVANVQSVATSDGAFAALRNDGTVFAWGSDFHGGSAPEGLAGVTSIASTTYAFAARKNDGSVVTWGAAFAGGDSSSVALADVEEIVGNQFAFAARTSNDTVITWGSAQHGGDSSAVTLENVKSLASTDFAFAALTFDKEVVSWGHLGSSRSAPLELEGVEALFTTGHAFVALLANDALASWGQDRLNQDIANPFDPYQDVTAPVYTGALTAGSGNSLAVATAPTSNAASVTIGYAASGLRPLFTREGTIQSYYEVADICSVDQTSGQVTTGSAAAAGDVCEVTASFEAAGFQNAASTLNLTIQ